MTSPSTRPVPPALDSPELAAIIAEIAADARRRLEADSSRPERAMALIREHLLGAVRLPVAVGGAGYSEREFFELLIRLAEADPDVPHILRMHYGAADGNGLQTEAGQRRLQRVLDGKILGGAQAEPTTQPGTYNYDTVLKADGDNYRLNGRKFYTTGALYADFLNIAAVNDGGQRVTVSIPAYREGVLHVDDWDGIGQRQTGSGTTVLENVLVYPQELEDFSRREVDGGQAAAGRGGAHLYLHAIGAGILRSLTNETANLLRQRTRAYAWGNTPEARHDPQLLAVVGSLASTAYLVEAAVLAAADALGRSGDYLRENGALSEDLEFAARLAVAKVKVAVEEISLRAAGDAYNAGGASWVRESVHLDRHWRNLRTLFSHNPTVYKARVVGDVIVNDGDLPPTFF